MLAEAVVAEQNVFAGHVGEHGVGPVKHGRFYKNQFAVAQVQGVPGLYVHKVPVLMVMAPDDALALFCAVDGHIGNFFHEGRQGAAMIDFIMVHDHVIDLLQVNGFFQMIYVFFIIGFPAGIDQGSLLILHQIGVIGRAFICRQFMAVEIH